MVGSADSLFALNFTDCEFTENKAGHQDLEFPTEEELPVQIHTKPRVIIDRLVNI